MMIRIKAPNGKMIRHIPTERLYSEVICDEKKRNKYELVEDANTSEVKDVSDS